MVRLLLWRSFWWLPFADDLEIRHTEFTLEKSMLPSFISEQTAEAILFVGRAMNTMRTSGVNDGEHLIITLCFLLV